MRRIPRHWSDLQRFVDGEVVPALEEDVEVARGYFGFGDKGKPSKTRRRTIMTLKKDYAVGEEVRVIHVLEVFAEGVEMKAMGPKRVSGEFLEGQEVTAPAPRQDIYDGPLVPSPAIDFFWDITTYRLGEAGEYRIYWHPEDPRSNTLTLRITDRPTPGSNP